jgi:hypothetical protein
LVPPTGFSLGTGRVLKHPLQAEACSTLAWRFQSLRTDFKSREFTLASRSFSLEPAASKKHYQVTVENVLLLY